MYTNFITNMAINHQNELGWDFAESIVFPPPPGTRPRCELHALDRVGDPADTMWLADTASTRNWEGGLPAARGRMIANFNPYVTARWEGRIQLAHSLRANTLFYDGHAASLGVRAMSDAASNILVFFTKELEQVPEEVPYSEVE
jgi:prepilin-type processing-associated H-X9-DG protein